MRFHNQPATVQAKAIARNLTNRLGTIVLFKQVREILWCDADTLIRDAHDRIRGLLIDMYHDRGSAW